MTAIAAMTVFGGAVANAMDKSRAGFEAWALEAGFAIIFPGGRFGMSSEHTMDVARKAWQASRKQTMEEASQEAATWKGAKLLLNAGEMTMQEKRTATAVALGIASAIRSLEGNATLETFRKISDPANAHLFTVEAALAAFKDVDSDPGNATKETT